MPTTQHQPSALSLPLILIISSGVLLYESSVFFWFPDRPRSHRLEVVNVHLPPLYLTIMMVHSSIVPDNCGSIINIININDLFDILRLLAALMVFPLYFFWEKLQRKRR